MSSVTEPSTHTVEKNDSLLLSPYDTHFKQLEVTISSIHEGVGSLLINGVEDDYSDFEDSEMYTNEDMVGLSLLYMRIPKILATQSIRRMNCDTSL